MGSCGVHAATNPSGHHTLDQEFSCCGRDNLEERWQALHQGERESQLLQNGGK
jgi:hypothetical protein